MAMICKIVWILSVALYVHGEKEAISEQKVTIHHQKADRSDTEPHIEKKKYEYHDEHAQEYPSYEFSYKVNDPITHDIKGQHEKRDGDDVKGLYWLVDPNGRTRTVNYQSNGDEGFNAQVALTGYLRVEEDKSKENEGYVGPYIKEEEVEKTETESDNKVLKDNVKYDDSNDEQDNQSNTETNSDGAQNNADNAENSNSANNNDLNSGNDEQNTNSQNSEQNKEGSSNNDSQEKAEKKESYDNNEGNSQNLKRKNRKSYQDENQFGYESRRQIRTDERKNKRVNKESVKQYEDRNIYNSKNKIKSSRGRNLNNQENNLASDNNEKHETHNGQNDNNNKISNKKNNERSKEFNSNTVTSPNLDASENKIRNNNGRRNIVDKKVEVYEHTIRIHHPKHIQYNNGQT